MAAARGIVRALAAVKLAWTVGRGRLLGIGTIVRALRNPDPRLTVRLLRAFGARVGEGSTIKRSLLLDNVSEDAHSAGDFRHLVIGERCYIGDDVYLDLANRIELGDRAILSGRVSIITHADCNRSPWLEEHFPRQCAPVHIGEGAWIGFGATILAGVTVGANAVVAAGSVVRDDVSPRTVVAGIPARVVRNLAEPGVNA